MSLSKKIDFAVIFKVKNANPNGDPLNGNRPRTTYAGIGEVSDVCLKRKMRDRLLEGGAPIFVQSDDNTVDGFGSLRERAESVLKNTKKKEETVQLACNTWFDVRAFGLTMAYKSGGKKGEGVSIPIRGPVSVHAAFSVRPVEVDSLQITKSVSNEPGEKRGSDTMGMKHRIGEAVYVFFGSMNPQLSAKTGFSDEDAAQFKAILPRLFENDASSARPEGSMAVLKVLWWEHASKSGQYSSAKVHGSLHVEPDGSYTLDDLPGLAPEEIDGF
jgi:CRISPR-associated protein Csd2